MKKDLRATWPQALLTFLGPILVVLTVRWLLVEPFVIPSGSMYPALHINDHIFVNKLSFGLKIPFGQQFVLQWGHPRRGDILVFRYPENPNVFFVKRVLAIGGDSVEVKEGVVFINGQALPQESIEVPAGEDAEFSYFREDGKYVVRYLNKDLSGFAKFQVPEKSFFVIGDNRDQSSDSRYWGVVSEELMIGRAKMTWLACDRTLEAAPVLCDIQTLRLDRMFKGIPQP